MSDRADVRLSPLDEERFGVRTARAEKIDDAGYEAMMDFCRSQGVQFDTDRQHGGTEGVGEGRL